MFIQDIPFAPPLVIFFLTDHHMPMSNSQSSELRQHKMVGVSCFVLKEQQHIWVFKGLLMLHHFQMNHLIGNSHDLFTNYILDNSEDCMINLLHSHIICVAVL